MPAAVNTTTRELGDSRVRVDVEIASDEVERALEGAAREIGRDLKLPGFRRGKVPPPVVIQRMGREAVLGEAVQRALPDWYHRALSEAGVAAIGEPAVNMGDLPERGDALSFSIEVGTRPRARLGEYRGLEVGRREPEAGADEVEAELERLRESLASLETVDRAAASGDFVVIDFLGRVDGEPFEGGEARAYLLELGSGRLIEGFEHQLVGASAGEERQVEVSFPDDYRNEALAGKDAVFDVTVKEVKEKRLPELNDELAAQAGGFDTLDELREDVAARVREVDEQRVERDFREAVVDAAVAASKLDVPHDLVHAKAHEMWHETARRMAAQGLDPNGYLQMVGKTEEELVKEAEPEAERALGRESVLAAIVEAEGIEVTDDEVMEALRGVAGDQPGRQPSEKALRRSLEKARKSGRDELLREDIAMRKAVDLLVEGANPIPVEQAKARDKLWTPGKEEGEEARRLWTPGT